MSTKNLLKVGLPVHPFSPTLPIHGLLLVSGAGGGHSGPAGLYDNLRHEFTHNTDYPVITVQMDYRRPADLRMSVEDIVQTMQHMKDHYHVKTVTLMGWSFGGAVVIAGAGQVMLNNKNNQLFIQRYHDADDDDQDTTISSINSSSTYPIVRGIITLGSQTYGTDAIHHLHKADLSSLFIHGKADTCLSPACSEQLYRHYKGSKKHLLLYQGDDHGCSQHRADVLQRVKEFVMNIVKTDNKDIAAKDENTSPNNA